MQPLATRHPPAPSRRSLARNLKALREDLGWTQAQVAELLGLSQGWYSEIERGKGSLSAEQFLCLLQASNASVARFAVAPAEEADQVQSALERLGASHLQVRRDLLPDPGLDDPAALIKAVLLGDAEARQVAALAPVLERHLDRVSLPRLWSQFVDYGFAGRLGWLLENCLEAYRAGQSAAAAPADRMRLRKRIVALEGFLDHVRSRGGIAAPGDPCDVLGAAYSRASRDEDARTSSDISRRWGIVSRLHPGDFVRALAEARDAR